VDKEDEKYQVLDGNVFHKIFSSGLRVAANCHRARIGNGNSIVGGVVPELQRFRMERVAAELTWIEPSLVNCIRNGGF
jgi:hypothetical protein